MLTATDPRTNTTTYSYDAANRPLTVVDPLTHAITSTYDLHENPRTRTDALGHATLTAYDAEGNRLSMISPRGDVTTDGYDADNRLITVTDALSGATTYGYDEVGDRTAVTDALTHTTTTAYDLLGRVTSVTSPLSETVSYGYAAAGNRTGVTTTAYSYNAANELTVAGATTYGYDADGNRLTATTDGATTTYGYDDANYLTGLASGAHDMIYTYNGDHARVGSAVDGVTTGYVLDLAAGLPTILQQATLGVTTTYLYGAGLLGQDDGTDLQTLLPDALGSTRLVASSGGAIVGHASYDAYGAQTTSGAGSVFGFTGQQTDAANGLVYLRARSYDPATGVFLQRDPYPFDPNNPVTVNRYTYANANPTNESDPSGLFVYGLCGNVGAGFIFGGSIQVCIVSADFRSLGLSGTVAGQVQTGSPSVDVGLQVQISDDKSISDLSGGSYYAGASAGAGLDVGVDVSTSKDECGNFSRPSPSVTIGVGAGVEEHAGYSQTQAIDFGNLIPKVY